MVFREALFRVINNTTQLLKFSVVAILLSMVSFVSMADDFSPQQCSNLKRQDGFSIAFTVPDPNPVTITFTSNNSVVKLWSSVSSSNAKIIDSDVNPGERVLLVYKPTSSNGKQGNLIYKLDTGSGYIQQQPPVAIRINGGNGTLQVSGDTVVVECAEGEEEPDPIPDLKDVHYEFGSIEGMDCTHGCNLKFDNSYDNPIVFLMSTIDSSTDGILESVPTKASVATIWDSKEGVTIESESAPGNVSSDRMSPIYYFVTEPGRLEFYDPSQQKSVYGEAGVISTGLAQCTDTTACDRDDDWEDVEYRLGNIVNPVIMAQVQGKDTNNWATTAIQNVEQGGFELSLERGRQGPLGGGVRYIAYMVVPEFHGKDKYGLSNIEFYQGSRLYRQKEELPETKSIGWSCKNNKVPLHQDFEKFGVIVNKQSRNGPHGGWLRYCHQSYQNGSPEYTFALDEDADSLKNRRHSAEESIGYFAFEIPPVEIPVNVCSLFPEPIQSWTGSNSSLVVNNGSDSKFIGWSPDYVNAFTIDNDRSWNPSNPNPEKLLLLGFDSEGGTNQMYNHDVCGDDLGCAVGNEDSQLIRRKIDHNLLSNVPSRSVTETLSVDKNIKARCDASNLCSFELAGSNANVYINEDLKRLYINDLGNEYQEIRVHLKDNLYIDDFEISNGNGLVLVIPEQSSVTFNKFLAKDTDNSDFIFENSSKINVVTSFKFQRRVDIAHDSAYPIIYAPDATVQLQGDFRGFILAKKLTPLNSLTVQGAVTALDVHSTSGLVINKPDYSCPLPPIEEGELTVTPIELHSLTCDVAEVEFAIKKNGQVVESVNDNFIATVKPSSNAQWCENQDGTNCFDSGHSFAFDNGMRTLYLKSSVLKNKPGYEVSGKWNGNEVASEQFIEFVPFKIEFPDAPYDVIAGQSNSNLVKAQVTYCASNDKPSPIATDYIGSPKVNLDIQAPYDGYHNEELIEYEPKFEAGESGITIDDLAIDESGEFFVTLTDSEFDCSELGDGCPIDGTGVLSGSFKLNSRPWTIAICDVKNIDGTRTNPGKTIEKGSGSYFIPAGELFKATFKPVIHNDYYSRNGLTVPTLCAHRSAQNYYTVDQSGKEHSAPFTITFDLEYPASSTGASLANLEGFSENYEFSKPSGQSQPVTREESFVWNEVGSVLLKSDANYHDKDLAQSTQTIGRFYPDYFRVTGTTWTEPDDQTGFTYMSQNFKNVNFQVTAYNAATPNNQPTNNYQHFDPTLTREFDLAGAYSDRVSISTGDLSRDYWNSGAIWDASFTEAQWWRLGHEQSSTIPDGPFNSGDSFGTDTELKLTIVSDANGDPAAFKADSSDEGTQDEQLLAQPHVRYGRMVLTNVGTTTNQEVRVPLRVEYWQGVNGFVLSSGDNASQFDVDEQCREIIWSDASTSNAELFNSDPNETDTVSNGEAGVVFARQGSDSSVNYDREQVRLFLRQGTGSPADVSCSWSDGTQDYLQFDWRRLGDEDPSTVVTFGIYRGNDRVIYRGESGLTGQ
ncbi:exported hypothetical protein [Vibrio coralliirubri]|uniref:DUF6701 domain-containing protein n=1 Tax=Vibrio coralliirubri TaxID=1516159 RepID=A0AA87C272_9VIBR|nr:DUF6701 domain-containing protein [Vibrio coralliirubri]CDT94487.1 exported hypothetical protein [Vibrio coralliirubri]